MLLTPPLPLPYKGGERLRTEMERAKMKMEPAKMKMEPAEKILQALFF